MSVALYLNVNVEAELNRLFYSEGGHYPGLIFVTVTSFMLPDNGKMNTSGKLICIYYFYTYTHTRRENRAVTVSETFIQKLT